MKRGFILLLTVVAAGGLGFLLLSRSVSRKNDPAFVAGQPSTVVPFKRIYYDVSALNPFAGGKMWVWTTPTPGAGKIHIYLYDLEKQAIAGELFHASLPVLYSGDNSQLLCQGADSSVVALETKTLGIFQKASGGRLPAAKRTETFWFLDTRNNSATRAGAIAQWPGTGSSWHVSPDFRHGYTTPFLDYDKAFYLFDFDARIFRKIPFPGEDVVGWWDEQHLLVESADNEFSLFDIATEKSRIVFGAGDVNNFLVQSGLTNDPDSLHAFAHWNGRDFDFYFSPGESAQGLTNVDAYLVKADRAGPALKLLYRNFRFRWSGELDSAGTHYLYEGEQGAPGRGGDGSVYLEDLINATTITVVPPDHKGQYSIPRFYGNEVIYYRDGQLRRIGCNGSNDAPLLSVSTK